MILTCNVNILLLKLPEDKCGGFVVSLVNYKQLSLSFWGADDTYMKKFFDSEFELRKFVASLPCIISQDWLHSCGFRFSI